MECLQKTSMDFGVVGLFSAILWHGSERMEKGAEQAQCQSMLQAATSYVCGGVGGTQNQHAA